MILKKEFTLSIINELLIMDLNCAPKKQYLQSLWEMISNAIYESTLFNFFRLC